MFLAKNKTDNMSLEKRLMQDLKVAMKSKNEVAKRSIRAVKNAILLTKTDGSGAEITEEMEIKIVQKLIKQRKESLGIYEQQGREDLAVVERGEIEVLQVYLPAQMSAEELEAKLRVIISQVGAESMRDMGKVMGVASKEFAGKADGKAISSMVKSILG